MKVRISSAVETVVSIASSLVGRMGLNILVRGSGAAANFVLVLVLASAMKQSEAGIYFTWVNVVLGVSVVGRLGYDVLFPRLGIGRSDERVERRFLYSPLLRVLAASSLLSVPAYLYLNQVFHGAAGSYWQLAAGAVFLASCYLFSGLAKATKRPALAAFVERSGYALLLLMVAVLLAAIDDQIENSTMITATVVSYLAVAGFGWLVLSAPRHPTRTIVMASMPLAAATPVIFAAICTYGANWIPAISSANFLSQEDVAKINYIQRFCNLLSLPLISINAIVASPFVEMFRTKSGDLCQAMRKTRASLLKVVSAGVIALVGVCLVFSNHLGMTPHEALLIAAPFMVSALFAAYAGPLGVLLISCNQDKAYLSGAVVGLGVTILSSVSLAGLGVVYVGIAVLLGTATQNVYWLIISKYRLDIGFSIVQASKRAGL